MTPSAISRGDGRHHDQHQANAAHFQTGAGEGPSRLMSVDQMPFGHWGALAYFAGVCLALLALALFVATAGTPERTREIPSPVATEAAATGAFAYAGEVCTTGR